MGSKLDENTVIYWFVPKQECDQSMVYWHFLCQFKLIKSINRHFMAEIGFNN